MPSKGKTIDPVCGEEVDPNTEFRAGFKGETYNFCSEKDKKEFQGHPEVYIRKMQHGETSQSQEQGSSRGESHSSHGQQSHGQSHGQSHSQSQGHGGGHGKKSEKE